MRVATLWILVAAGLLAGGGYLFNARSGSGSTEKVILHVAALKEASGLAASLRTPDLLWSHNDSGGLPVLYGFGLDGKPRGALRIVGTKNVDWEALASFELDGESWIAIGDIGDNLAGRKDRVIHVIEEPVRTRLSPLEETMVTVAWSVPFRFESGPHDCETMLVDVRRREFVLVTKRTTPPELYTLPLRPGAPAPKGGYVAVKMGTIAHLPQTSAFQRLLPLPSRRYRHQPTDGSFSPDGLSAAILTYGDVLLYRRQAGQSWPAAFQQKPLRLAPHGLSQAEALCFAEDGHSLFVTGEQKDAPLLRYSLPP